MLRFLPLLSAIVLTSWAVATEAQEMRERDFSGVGAGVPGLALHHEDPWKQAQFSKCAKDLFQDDEHYKDEFQYDKSTGTMQPRPGFGFEDLSAADQTRCLFYFFDKTDKQVTELAESDATSISESVANAFGTGLYDLRFVEQVDDQGDKAFIGDVKQYNDIYLRYLPNDLKVSPSYQSLLSALQFMERWAAKGIHLDDKTLYGGEYRISFEEATTADGHHTSSILLSKLQPDKSYAKWGEEQTITDQYGDIHKIPVVRLKPYVPHYEWVQVLEVHPEVHESEIFSSFEYANFPFSASDYAHSAFCKIKVDVISVKGGRWGFNVLTPQKFEFYYHVDAAGSSNHEVWAKVFVAFPNAMQMADPKLMQASCDATKVLSNGGPQQGACTCVYGHDDAAPPTALGGACNLAECQNKCVENGFEYGIWEGDTCSKDEPVYNVPIPEVQF